MLGIRGFSETQAAASNEAAQARKEHCRLLSVI